MATAKNSNIEPFSQSEKSQRPKLATSPPTPFKLARLFVPGAFLFILGLGNIGVGHYKTAEYQELMEELSVVASEEASLPVSSPLKRIELAEVKNKRFEENLAKARARLDFYSLVSFGGKLMLALSFILFVVTSFIFIIRKQNESF